MRGLSHPVIYLQRNVCTTTDHLTIKEYLKLIIGQTLCQENGSSFYVFNVYINNVMSGSYMFLSIVIKLTIFIRIYMTHNNKTL